jgi:hypothetical protein
MAAATYILWGGGDAMIVSPNDSQVQQRHGRSADCLEAGRAWRGDFVCTVVPRGVMSIILLASFSPSTWTLWSGWGAPKGRLRRNQEGGRADQS